MINPFLYGERHLPVGVECADGAPRRLLGWLRRPAAAPTVDAPAPRGVVGSADPARPGRLMLRRIPR